MALGQTYFAGNDFPSWVQTGSVVVNNSGGFRSSWVALVMQVTCTSVADPPPDRITSAQFVDNMNAPTSVSTFWAHAICVMPAGGIGNTANATLMRCLDAGGVARIVVRGTGSTGTLKVDKRSAAGTFTNLFTATAGALTSTGSAVNFIDLKVIYDNMAGEVTLFVNDNQVGTFSGDVTTDAATDLAFVDFSSPANGNAVNWSECIVSDSLTINAGLFRLTPLAAGVTQDWAGAFTDISKTLVNDTTFISSGTNDQLSGWTTPVTLPTGNWLIQSVVQEARAAVGISGPQHFDWYIRTADAVDNLASVNNAPSTLFSNFPSYIWAQNPSTATDWVVGDIVAGFNLGVKSLA